jgi:acetyltransferase-like isoleucine patch superfamily enzyme
MFLYFSNLIYLLIKHLENLSNAYRIELLKRKSVLEIGEFTYGKPKVIFWNYQTKLKIGKFCSISDGVTFILGGNHRKDWISTFPFSEFNKVFSNANENVGHPSSKGNIIVGNDVWIGYGSIILSGVEIGDGAVIGAGSVVASSVEPYSINVGNPARKIGIRFDKEILKKVDLENWWNYSNDKINSIVSKLMDKPELKN